MAMAAAARESILVVAMATPGRILLRLEWVHHNQTCIEQFLPKGDKAG
jgi:hypothetical protein